MCTENRKRRRRTEHSQASRKSRQSIIFVKENNELINGGVFAQATPHDFFIQSIQKSK